MQEAGIHFAKTHNLLNLLNDLLPIEPSWVNLHKSLAFLTVYAVKYRYPGDSADKVEAKESVKNCRLIRKTVRQSFALSTEN
ncbi:MAG: HEPN domain-containing protein [Acidobacteriota bacterium]|nr:HEPN domain-containing protein [Acidobacteriota bacterium]